MSQSQLSAYLASGKVITHCPPRPAFGHLVWGISTHPTRNLPLSLGVVGRW